MKMLKDTRKTLTGCGQWLVAVIFMLVPLCVFCQETTHVVVTPINSITKRSQKCSVRVYNHVDTSFISMIVVEYDDNTHEFDVESGKRYFVRCIPQKVVIDDEGRERRVADDALEEVWADLDLVSNKEKLVRLDSIYIGKRMSKQLEEVAVTSSRILFYHHGDTLIYNASAFVVAEGSMLDALVEQLPGVRIDSDGVIHCNGRRVDDLLLNGKDLFNGKSELMLENLAAYTVKNIAVYDKRGALSEMVGRNLREDTRHVMDVRLKRDYLTGFILNAEAGYGTEGRYLGKLFGIGFTDYGSISAYAGINNLSDRNKPGRADESWSRERMGSGVNKKSEGGVAYTLEGTESRWNAQGSVDVLNSKDDIRQSVESQLYLPGGNRSEIMRSKEFNKNLSVTTSHSFNLKASDRVHVNVIPQLEYGKTRSERWVQSMASGDQEEVWQDFDRIMAGEINPESLIYRNRSMSFGDGRAISAALSGSARVVFGQDYMTLHASGNYSDKRPDGYNGYAVDYADNSVDNVNELQYRKNHPDYVRRVVTDASYCKYISNHGINATIKYSVDHGKTVNNESLYVPGSITDVALISGAEEFETIDWVADNLLSYGTSQMHTLHTVGIGGYNQKMVSLPGDLNLMVNLQRASVGFSSRRMMYMTSAAPVEHRRSSVLPGVTTQISINDFKRKAYLMLNVQSEVRDVNMRDLIDLPQTDPLVRHMGNPDLKNVWYNELGMNFRKERGQKNHSVDVRYNAVSNKVAQSYVYNTSTGARTYRPYNVDGDWNLRGAYEFFMPFGSGGSFDVSSTTSGNYGHNVNFAGVSTSGNQLPDFDNMEQRVVKSLGVGETLKLDYSFKRNRLTLFGNMNMGDYRSRDAGFNDFVSWTINYGSAAVVNLPYNWSVSTDLTMYMRRGYNDRRLNTTDLLWNARLSKTIMQGRVVIAADAYDILRQLSNITYVVNALSRVETVSNVVPSFVLFHVQYRFNR